jgi:hypothetical protein
MIRPILFLVLTVSVASAIEFKKDIQPILKAQCYKCHSEAAKKEKGGFVFDNLERFAKDIGPGRVIEPGNLAESHFFETLVSPDSDDAHMPPNETLSDGEITKVREWIQAGASLGKEKSPTIAKTETAPPAVPPATTPAAPSRPATLQDWTNSEGKVIQATMLRLEGTSVVLQLTSGQTYNYPLEKLSSASQQMARRGGS